MYVHLAWNLAFQRIQRYSKCFSNLPELKSAWSLILERLKIVDRELHEEDPKPCKRKIPMCHNKMGRKAFKHPLCHVKDRFWANTIEYRSALQYVLDTAPLRKDASVASYCDSYWFSLTREMIMIWYMMMIWDDDIWWWYVMMIHKKKLNIDIYIYIHDGDIRYMKYEIWQKIYDIWYMINEIW